MSFANSLNRYLLLPLFVLFVSCTPPQSGEKAGPVVTYNVDITRPLEDQFDVTITVSGLTSANNVYNMPATAPGTYQNLDFGRYVNEFRAYDASGDLVPVEQTSMNTWTISDPTRVVKVTYKADDTFDTPVEGEMPAPMSGSGIDSTYAAFNTFAVLGYFQGMQSVPVRMKVDCVPGWTVATALDEDPSGYYVAETYDRLVDSPVLAGELTEATTRVRDMDVSVYVWSRDSALSAQNIMSVANDVLLAGGDFAGSSPVPYYKFLMVLIDMDMFQRYGLRSAGALEHSYSSIYVMPSAGSTPQSLRSTMAHEFMHILTPLNLHSEIIDTYNFAEATPSQHLWLYEGVTEWVADIMQLRGGLITPDVYFREVSSKMRTSEVFPNELSLTDMAKQVYTDAGSREYANIYSKGALTAMCLDFRLLELSGEKRGLREVFLEMLDQYGKNRPFPEETFFDVFVKATYPEIQQFFDDHVKANKPLPIAQYAEKVGFRYVAQRPSANPVPTLGAMITVDTLQHLVIARMTDEGKAASELREGDILVKLFGSDLTMQTAREVLGKVREMKAGDPYEAVVIRDGQEMTVKGATVQRMDRHAFEEMEELTTAQQHFRQVWSSNLERGK